MAEHDLQAVAFPTLDEAQVATLGSCAGAPLTKYRAGQTLFRCGDRDAKFFIIKSGQVEIRDETGDAPRVVVVHKPGEFTGEAAQLTGRPAVVTAVAQTDCEVYPVSPEALRHILNRCPDLGDLILQAFIARQQLLRESAGFTGLRVIGSRYSPETFRVRDFLARNRIWFTWLDLESDLQVDQLLKQFGVTEADTPVVACGHIQGVRSHWAGPGSVAELGREVATVSARNQPAGRVRGRGCAIRLGQARRVGRRRGCDGSPVRARVSEGNVMQIL